MPSIDGRVARWALGFDKLMDDPMGLRCFQVCAMHYTLANNY